MLYVALVLAVIAAIANWKHYPRVAFWAGGGAAFAALISVIMLFTSLGA